MDREKNIELAKRSIIDSIWKEAHLEGIGVTYLDTKEIFEGRTVPGISVDDTVAINNLKHAWQFILDDLDAPTDLSFIRQVHYLVGSAIVSDPGNLRMGDVGIGGTTWKPDIPDFDDAKARIEELATRRPTTTRDALELFAYLCRSQLFFDGNKRTAQIVTNKVLIENGLGIFAVPTQDKSRFESELISFYESGEPSSLIHFLKETSVTCYEECKTETHPDPALEALKAKSVKEIADDEIAASKELSRSSRIRTHHPQER